MQSYETSRFMEILKSGDIENINVWANANGLEAVFTKLAVLDAFIDKLFANEAKIRDIFSNQIEIAQEGGIQSEGFVSGQSQAGFRILGSGAAEFVDAIVKGSVTADTVDSDSLKTYKEELPFDELGNPIIVEDIGNVATAWNIPNTLNPLFGYYTKQLGIFAEAGAGSSYKGKGISKVGVCINSGTTTLGTVGNVSRGFKDNSATWHTINIKNLLGSAYVEGARYQFSCVIVFKGDWVVASIERIRDGVETQIKRWQHTDIDETVTFEVQADDIITFWGGNQAWPIFGTKTMYIQSQTLFDDKAGTAPFVSEVSVANVSKSNSGSSWVSQDIGSTVIVPVGARNLRLRYSSRSIASGTTIGTHYYVRLVVNGIERATNYSLGSRYTPDIPVTEGDSVQLRLYVAPRFNVTTKDEDNNDVVTTYTPSVSIASPYIVFVSAKEKGLMLLMEDDTSEFIPYVGIDRSEYTESILSLLESAEFPHSIIPTNSKYTLTRIKQAFVDKGFGDGSVVTCAAEERPTLNIDGVNYLVNRIFIHANHISFSTTVSDIAIYDFNANKVTYNKLTLSEVIPVSQRGENRTKHIAPLETLKYSIGDRANDLIYDIVSSRVGDFNSISGTSGIIDAITADSLTLGIKSLATNGYTQLPNGVILQWGQFTASGNTTPATVTFPIAFPSACVAVAVSSYRTTSSSDGYGHHSSLSRTSVRLNGIGGVTSLYIAVGY